MMAIMTDGNKEELPKEFVEGGRTGRRNAMPDILHSDANVTTADLPDRLQQLATSVVQSPSSPSTDLDSDSSNDSEKKLRKFLSSKCSARRNALLASRDQATTVTSKVFSASVSEALLDDFMHSGCCQRRNALPCITPKPPGDNKESTSTYMLSEQSLKPSCSHECLQKFLNSSCSKRRSAVPSLQYGAMSEGTSG
ncbi:hypothetical protein O0L34_g8327 [Tuta absoluta]|nr:hypothetical protein O0L34_g8327 [Tuta absoluta]